ncbi:MAG: ATP-binding protein [Bacteroidota bacterium]
MNNTNKLFTAIALVVSTSLQAQPDKKLKLEKIWETDTIIRTPESVYFDFKRSTLYVSLIDGAPWEADGKGGIAKMSVDGTTVDQDWIKGLHCPKGIGVSGNKMYVADLNTVVVINIKKGTIEKRINPEGAVNLNDVTVTPSGIVYVSDSKNATVYKIEEDKAALFLDSLPGVNGLSYVNNELIIASGKDFLKINSRKERIPLAALPQGGDGIEPAGNGGFIVSSWPGYIYFVNPGGKVDLLLDTHEAKKNTADIGFDPYTGMVYVPTFFGKTIAAYKIKQGDK